LAGLLWQGNNNQELNFISLTLFLPLLETKRNGSFTISSSFHLTLADPIPIGGHPHGECGREFILEKSDPLLFDGKI